MCDYSNYAVLYEYVLYDTVNHFLLTQAEISKAVNDMITVYTPDPTSLTATNLNVADYDDPAHRCAYLHKWATFHTSLVADMFREVVLCNIGFFRGFIHNTRPFNICCIGGGPGSEIVGILAVLNSIFGCFETNATLVDLMIGWRQTFSSIVSELQSGRYNYLMDIFSNRYFNWSYEVANMLEQVSPEVNSAIESADLITMVKFVSASACKDTPAMIRRIFTTMKPGAVVLYIDNAGGGFHELMRKEAAACNLITVYGPLKHKQYINNYFNIKRFGYPPCVQTTITAHMWRKPGMYDCLGVNQIDCRNWSVEEEYSHFPSHPIKISVVNNSAQNNTEEISEQIVRQPDMYKHFHVNQVDYRNWSPEEYDSSFNTHQISTANHSTWNATAVLPERMGRNPNMYNHFHFNQIDHRNWSPDEQHSSFPIHQISTANYSAQNTTAVIPERMGRKPDMYENLHFNQIDSSHSFPEKQSSAFRNIQISIGNCHDNLSRSERNVLLDCPVWEQERPLPHFSNPRRVNSRSKENGISRHSRIISRHARGRTTLGKIKRQMQAPVAFEKKNSWESHSIYDRQW